MNIRTGLTAAAAACILTLTSCSTSSFMGLSKSSHVDAELEKMRTEIEEFHDMENELDAIIGNEEKLQDALDRLTKIAGEQSSEMERMEGALSAELNRLEEELAAELGEIPEVTLMQLVEAIEAYLETADAPAEQHPAPPADTEPEPTAPEDSDAGSGTGDEDPAA